MLKLCSCLSVFPCIHYQQIKSTGKEERLGRGGGRASFSIKHNARALSTCLYLPRAFPRERGMVLLDHELAFLLTRASHVAKRVYHTRQIYLTTTVLTRYHGPKKEMILNEDPARFPYTRILPPLPEPFFASGLRARRAHGRLACMNALLCSALLYSSFGLGAGMDAV